MTLNTAHQMRRTFEKRLSSCVAEINGLLMEQGIQLLYTFNHEDPDYAVVEGELLAACQESRDARRELERVQAKYSWLSKRIMSAMGGRYGPKRWKLAAHDMDLAVALRRVYETRGRVIELKRKSRWASHRAARAVRPVSIQPAREEEISLRLDEIYNTLFQDLTLDQEDARFQHAIQRAEAALNAAQDKAKLAQTLVALFDRGANLLGQQIRNLEGCRDDLSAEEKTEVLAVQESDIQKLDTLFREVNQAPLKLDDSSRRAVHALDVQIEGWKRRPLPLDPIHHESPHCQLMQVEADRLAATKKLIDDANRFEKHMKDVLLSYSERWPEKVDTAKREQRQYREILVAETIRSRYMGISCTFTLDDPRFDI